MRLLLFFCLSFTPLFAQFDQGRWAVKTDYAPVYQNAETAASDKLEPYGFAFKGKNKKNGRVSFIQDNKELWIPLSYLVKIDFSIQSFSEESARFIPSPLNNKELVFIKEGGVYILSMENLENPKIKKKSDAPKVSGAYFSQDQSLLLLSGRRTDGLNLALLSPLQKKFVPLTVLFGEAALVSAEFSVDNALLALHTSLGDRQSLLLYSVDKGELFKFISNVQGYYWTDQRLIVIKKNTIVLISPDGIEKNLYTSSNNKELQAVFSSFGKEVLIDIDGLVYRFTGSSLEKTSYPSIELSTDGSLQRVDKNGTVTLTYNKKILRSLSGKTQRWDFDSFVGSQALLYRKKSATGAISTLYFYDAEKEESFPYVWVEEPTQVLDTGLAYEVIEDKGEVWLFFEMPGQWARMLRLKELL